MEETLIVQVENIFKVFFNDANIVLSESTTADDIENWNSLSHINLLDKIEKHFNFTFTFIDIVAFKNVGDMLICINKKLQSKNN